MILLLPALAARFAPFATAVSMTLLGSTAKPTLEVSQTRMISANPAAVWAVIGEFCDIRRWHRQARACALFHDEGQIGRNLDLRGIGTVVEIQLDRDEEAMTYSYGLVHSPWPVKQYRASLTVTPAADGTVVIWRATFRLEDACDEGAVARIEDLFRSGLGDIAHEVAR
ncbi:SRPBCC family protein [Methylobacterium mesophilicum SR1.6/6]|uniref:SRPBCC family protein n=1 Tax=Methylobacterium mesophilicum SR1.6/6 TaxID=908290 RepID=A0A6B9FLX2_9HYPH|nr:SRPBCC family protein [Methylobacterium mesophilicum]QGY03553.1 SRPBCC family protein [Methylobacterium mesophilicum SR1.6/6]